MSRNSIFLAPCSLLGALDRSPTVQLEDLHYANNRYNLTFNLVYGDGGGLVEGLYLDNKGNLTVDPWCDDFELAMQVFEILKSASLSKQ